MRDERIRPLGYQAPARTRIASHTRCVGFSSTGSGELLAYLNVGLAMDVERPESIRYKGRLRC